MRLPREFYTGHDVVAIARDLLGKILCTRIDGLYTSGIIVETEAYRGPEDKASHAFGGRRTARTGIMYAQGGTAYVYLCYGIHHLFNVVTASVDVPHAILIRAIEPLDGIEFMMARRKIKSIRPQLTAGPGALTVALGIHTGLSGTNLQEDKSPIWIEDRNIVFSNKQILTSPRVGVDYAAEWAKKHWRFRVKGNPWVSPAR